MIDQLPNEVLQQIFAQLPLYEVLLSHSLVCMRWKQIISNVRFMPWKKRYHRYRSQVKEAVDEMRALSVQHSITCIDDCLLQLVRFAYKLDEDENGKQRRHVDDATSLFDGHCKYAHTMAVLRDKFADDIWKNRDRRGMWSAALILIVFAENVWQVEEVLQSLLSKRCRLSAGDVIDRLYAFLVFLRHLSLEYGLPTRFHYQLLYAVYLYENESPDSPTRWKEDDDLKPRQSLNNSFSGSQPQKPRVVVNWFDPSSSSSKKKERQMTHEQMRIVNHRLKDNDLLKIIAFAGTGKTTTLVSFARQHPELKFLVVVYNKSVQQHAAQTFPSNCECRTAHSLAYEGAYVGRKYKHKLTFNIKAYNIAWVLPHRSSAGNVFRRAALVCETIDAFTYSADDQLDIQHVPTTHSGGKMEFEVLKISERILLLDDAKNIWGRIIDKTDAKVRMSNDCYLKLWQLQSPDLVKRYKVDCILLDEGQDMNPAILSVFENQNCPKVIVGDPNQQIYRFRGAVNGLSSVCATQTFHLTQSFRFGPEIGFVANCCVEMLKSECRQTLLSCRKRDSVLGFNSCDVGTSPTKVKTNGGGLRQLAVLGRTNEAIFKEAVDVVVFGNSECLDGIEEQRSFTVGFVGGVQSYNYNDLLNIKRLKDGKQHLIDNDDFKKRFKTYKKLDEYVSNSKDKELHWKMNIVGWAKDDLEWYVNSIQACTHDDSTADIVFTTVHKAKGMEWHSVKLLNDFSFCDLPFPEFGSGLKKRVKHSAELDEEYNLLYVAITRAKSRLLLNGPAYYLLLTAHQSFERVRLRLEEILDKDPTAKCFDCGCDIVQDTITDDNNGKGKQLLLLEREKVTLSGNYQVKSGPQCSNCSGCPYYFVPIVPRSTDLGNTDRFSKDFPDRYHIAMSALIGPSLSNYERLAQRYDSEKVARNRRVNGYTYSGSALQQRSGRRGATAAGDGFSGEMNFFWDSHQEPIVIDSDDDSSGSDEFSLMCNYRKSSYRMPARRITSSRGSNRSLSRGQRGKGSRGGRGERGRGGMVTSGATCREPDVENVFEATYSSQFVKKVGQSKQSSKSSKKNNALQMDHQVTQKNVSASAYNLAAEPVSEVEKRKSKKKNVAASTCLQARRDVQHKQQRSVALNSLQISSKSSSSSVESSREELVDYSAASTGRRNIAEYAKLRVESAQRSGQLPTNMTDYIQSRLNSVRGLFDDTTTNQQQSSSVNVTIARVSAVRKRSAASGHDSAKERGKSKKKYSSDRDGDNKS